MRGAVQRLSGTAVGRNQGLSHRIVQSWTDHAPAGAERFVPVDHPPPLNPSAPASSRQARLQQDTHFRVLRILQDNPDLTQRELADLLGVSVGALNYCLKALMEKGWVKMQNFSGSKNKFGYIYVLTPRGIAEKAALASNFLRRKLEEYDAMRLEIEILKSELVNDAPPRLD